ncbi:ABC transporter ATP-binding protein [Clostridiisalibacter paucivorans]|uniref:ABC transporter ATP-binding protein n=1 Tax=Clostridiisalibacter paucivorans TaxID=408753 RepID=UPI00047C1460|nr:ATP-binding cassette domain-containing protein [Clostridiisalibacter paucivorans]
MLKVESLSKRFHNPYGKDNIIFSNLSLEINKGDFVSIIGSNGAGKSTLLNIISGIIEPSLGRISLKDEILTDMPQHKRTQILSRVFQSPDMGACPSMTVRENLSMALNKGRLLNLRRCLRHSDEYLEGILDGVPLNLKRYMDVEVRYLSGGQKQALSLVMATISSPNILLLDEHTAALDPKTSNEIMDLTERIVNERNITTLMVTHNLKHALEYGNRLIMLHNGEIILDAYEEEKRKITIEDILSKFEYAV